VVYGIRPESTETEPNYYYPENNLLTFLDAGMDLEKKTASPGTL